MAAASELGFDEPVGHNEAQAETLSTLSVLSDEISIANHKLNIRASEVECLVESRHN